jgi:hypothetical protein
MCCAALFVACTKADPTPTAASTPTPVPTLSATAAPDPVATASAPPAASAEPDDTMCFSPEESQKNAKPYRNAEPPYAECAAGVFSHCPPDDSYCSIALNVARTKQMRATGKKLCCYGK